MNAIFMDGKSARKYECRLEFSPNKITIRYLDENGYDRVSNWQVDSILRIDLKTSSRMIKYGDFPHEVLEFHTQEDFDGLLERYPDAEFHKSHYNNFFELGWKGMTSALVGVVVVCLFFFFYAAPLIAETFARNIPKEYEEYLGNELHYNYLQLFTVDEEKTDYIQRFYNELNYESEYNIDIVVVETYQANAYALPGGHIVVFSGILQMIEDESELAGLLAHEVSHINHQHSLRSISRDLAMYVLFASISGDVSGFTSVIIDNSKTFSSLSYSREYEKEADLEGLKLMTKSNVDPNGMVELFKKIGHVTDSLEEQLSKQLTVDSNFTSVSTDTSDYWYDINWDQVVELMSTHPTPKNRIAYLEDEISTIEDIEVEEYSYALKFYFKKLKE